VPPFTVMKKDAEFLSRLSFTERTAFTWINEVQTQRVWDKFKTDVYPAITLYDRAGHNLQIEQEGLFNSLVSEWLDRVVEKMQD